MSNLDKSILSLNGLNLLSLLTTLNKFNLALSCVEIEADHVARVIIGVTILYVSIQDRRNPFIAQINLFLWLHIFKAIASLSFSSQIIQTRSIYRTVMNYGLVQS